MARRSRRWTHCLAALTLAGCVDLARPDRRRARPAAVASQRAEAASARCFHLTDEERRGAWTLLDRLGSRYRVTGRLRVLTRGEVTRAAETLLPSPIVDAHRGSHGWVFALESGALFTSPTYLATPREIVPPSCAPGDRRVVFQPSHGRLSVRGLDGAWRWSHGRSWGRVTVADASTVAWFGERGAAIVRHRTLWFSDDGGSRWREVPLGDNVAGWVGGRADGLFVLTDQGVRRIAPRPLASARRARRAVRSHPPRGRRARPVHPSTSDKGQLLVQRLVVPPGASGPRGHARVSSSRTALT